MIYEHLPKGFRSKSILGVFTTREKVDEYVESYRKKNWPKIELQEVMDDEKRFHFLARDLDYIDISESMIKKVCIEVDIMPLDSIVE